MRVSEAIAVELDRQGVRAVFTLMSEETAGLIVALAERGIPLYSTRHDSTAVGMADGYARASGRIGVAVVGRGPGLTNSINTLVTANKAGTGIVVLVGDFANNADLARMAATERHGKYINQEAFLSALGVISLTVDSANTASTRIAEAFSRARNGGLIVVRLPMDVLEESVMDGPAPNDQHQKPASVSEPTTDDIEMVADLLGETWAARHPVILAGRGAVTSGARDELVGLGTRIGALMGTSLMANSLFRPDAFNIGLVGTLATPIASELMVDADVVLVFGASLNTFTTYGGDLLRRARVVHFDSDAGAFGRYHPADLGVLGDARLSAARLVEELGRRGHQSAGYRSSQLAKKLKDFRHEDAIQDRGRRGALDPRMVMSSLDKLLPRERTLVIDGGHHFEFSATYLSVPDPSGFVFPTEYFSVGCGLASALGAAVARPDRLTVLDAGDGGFMMNLGDVDTAVRYRLPMVIIVSNDSGFGSEIHYLQVHGLPDATARYQNPSFEAVARGLGAKAITIDSLDQLSQLPNALENLDGPLVLDCKLTTEVRAGWVDFMFGKEAAAKKVSVPPTRAGA